MLDSNNRLVKHVGGSGEGPGLLHYQGKQRSHCEGRLVHRDLEKLSELCGSLGKEGPPRQRARKVHRPEGKCSLMATAEQQAGE